MSKALNKAHLSTEAGQQLLAMLKEITQDGDVGAAEVDRLRAWLAANRDATNVPGIAWLLELIDVVLLDGKISIEERYDLLQAFDRVLPQDERLLSKARRREAGTDKKPQLATAAQLSYLTYFGATFGPELTKIQASQMLDVLIAQRKGEEGGTSNRQMMVLRFWNKVEVSSRGKEGVSDWMDEWYREDERRLEAWQLWKQENADDGRQGNPTRVPIGAGYEYIKRVAGGAAAASNEAVARSSSVMERLIVWLLIKLLQVGVVAAVLIWILRAFFLPKT